MYVSQYNIFGNNCITFDFQIDFHRLRSSSNGNQANEKAEQKWRGAKFAMDQIIPLICTYISHISIYTNIHTVHIYIQYTYVGFYGLRGLSIGVMVFILYKLYVLLPYTYPTPKLSPHRRRCISIFPQKNSLCMIYKHFKLWGHWKCPHKSPSPCNTYVIPMSLYKFVSS